MPNELKDLAVATTLRRNLPARGSKRTTGRRDYRGITMNGTARCEIMVRCQVPSAQLERKNKDPYTQHSEPILFPMLRIYFADFPYPLCSIDHAEAAKLGNRMRLWVPRKPRITVMQRVPGTTEAPNYGNAKGTGYHGNPELR